MTEDGLDRALRAARPDVRDVLVAQGRAWLETEGLEFEFAVEDDLDRAALCDAIFAQHGGLGRLRRQVERALEAEADDVRAAREDDRRVRRRLNSEPASSSSAAEAAGGKGGEAADGESVGPLSSTIRPRQELEDDPLSSVG